MHVKICGIKTLSDALAAIDAGADMLGYNFYRPSKRYLPPEACAEIQNALAKRNTQVVTVGVFVNERTAEITRILAACNLGYAQLSGDEPEDALLALGKRAFKAIRPRTPEEAGAQAARYGQPGLPLLVDAFRPGEYGGTGLTADWSLARALTASHKLLLAGGLHPGNVAAAIEQVQPWGVDVASGVEASPGVKDAAKMRSFVEAVNQVIR